jgi:hypothetical protein
VPDSTATKVVSSTTNPVTTTSALAVSSTGVGAAFAYMAGNTPFVANNGTLLVTGMNGADGGSGDKGAISRQTSTGNWTPSFNENTLSGNGIVAATWT